MSLELVNTFATLGTFVVIAATAIAAIVQLRHARSSNHIAALNELRETTETPDFLANRQLLENELSTKLEDPVFRYQVATSKARTDETRRILAKLVSLGDFYESMGILVKTGLVDKALVFELWSTVVIGAWKQFAPSPQYSAVKKAMVFGRISSI